MQVSPPWSWSVHADAFALGAAVASDIVVAYLEAQAAGRPYLLGCPGGRTPRPIYREMARLGGVLDLDWSGLTIVMMDDYLVQDGDRLVSCPRDAHFSCRRFAEVEIVGLINAGRPVAQRIAADRLLMPDPQTPGGFDVDIDRRGGIDLFIVASGASDGHVAFNPPGSAAESRTRIIDLAETTRRDNLKTFPDFSGLEAVPGHGVTVGLQTIAAARRVCMVLHGTDKGESLRRVFAASAFDSAWPATFVHNCPSAAVHADRAAWLAAGLATAP